MTSKTELKRLCTTNPVEMAERLSELESERELLRNVFENARGLLRFNGVDKKKTEKYADELGSSIERIKAIDGQGGDFLEHHKEIELKVLKQLQMNILTLSKVKPCAYYQIIEIIESMISDRANEPRESPESDVDRATRLTTL